MWHRRFHRPARILDGDCTISPALYDQCRYIGTCDRRPSILKQAAELYEEGLSVRQVAAALRVSKTEAGRLRLRASDARLIVSKDDTAAGATNGHCPISLQA
jgi:hypothetical protein